MSSNPTYYQQSPAPAYASPRPQQYTPPYKAPYQVVQTQSPPPMRGSRGYNGNRTPSPTPSEAKLLGGGKTFDLRASLAPKRENMWFIIIFVLLLVVLVAFAILHDKIIRALQPALNWVHDQKLGWLIPFGLIIVLSFPPLFGSDFISVLCGVIYGPAIGFAISGGAILIGELFNYFTFKYLCRARSEKMKKNNIKYDCLSRVIQEGGLPVAIISRYSIIPSHVTTALFATCGMKLWVFVVSAIASLPKNFVNVYIGSTFEADAAGTAGKKSKLINIIVVAATVLITVFAMKFIDAKINAVKQEVVHTRQKARQFGASSEGLVSSSNIPLRPTQGQDIRYDTSYNV
ncbi:hypothetical protein FIBSPDRAFT_933874 [Athelia psychrophila]|uniref:Golgi apparatus membrane protein TVP38 n=2 Tax=Athelia psychrophila TaxID=1759441 RepID=A0A166GBD2_9AGAM|nr:hypothetical protein FIBSPDRAFT_933874 [Fibularhizoctonia sp. CBS 109695]